LLSFIGGTDANDRLDLFWLATARNFLYLRGLSTGDFRPALEGLLGEEAAGLSPTNIARLTAYWEKEYASFRARPQRARVRLRVGRWGALQHPARRRPDPHRRLADLAPSSAIFFSYEAIRTDSAIHR
jgi:hypothetical protein